MPKDTSARQPRRSVSAKTPTQSTTSAAAKGAKKSAGGRASVLKTSSKSANDLVREVASARTPSRLPKIGPGGPVKAATPARTKGAPTKSATSAVAKSAATKPAAPAPATASTTKPIAPTHRKVEPIPSSNATSKNAAGLSPLVAPRGSFTASVKPAILSAKPPKLASSISELKPLAAKSPPSTPLTAPRTTKASEVKKPEDRSQLPTNQTKQICLRTRPMERSPMSPSPSRLGLRGARLSRLTPTRQR